MGRITVFPSTTKNPITKIGHRAGWCWGRDVTDDEKNYKRGLDCIKNNHGRTLEFVDVELAIEGYSARVIREWCTHLGGSPTRLQESTRYVDYSNFNYITPHSIHPDSDAAVLYHKTMRDIQATITILINDLHIKREDAALLLPLGMTTKIVDKRNVQNLIDMSRQRMCNRANWEYRMLFNDILNALKEYSKEWKTLIEMTMMPKCDVLGYCPETFGCGRKPKVDDTQYDRVE